MFGHLKVSNLYLFTDLTRREFHLFLPLVSLTIFLGIYPNLILQGITTSVNNYINLL